MVADLQGAHPPATPNPLSFFLKNPDIVVQCSHMENILIPSPANKDTGRLPGKSVTVPPQAKQQSLARKSSGHSVFSSPGMEQKCAGVLQPGCDQRGDHLPLSLGEQEEQRSLRPYGIFSTSSDSPTLFPAFSFFFLLCFILFQFFYFIDTIPDIPLFPSFAHLHPAPPSLRRSLCPWLICIEALLFISSGPSQSPPL